MRLIGPPTPCDNDYLDTLTIATKKTHNHALRWTIILNAARLVCESTVCVYAVAVLFEWVSVPVGLSMALSSVAASVAFLLAYGTVILRSRKRLDKWVSQVVEHHAQDASIMAWIAPRWSQVLQRRRAEPRERIR